MWCIKGNYKLKQIIFVLLGMYFGIAVAIGDGFEIASQYSTVFTKQPVKTPSDSAVDGPLLGNGDMLVAIGGAPQEQRFYIGKSDLWYMPHHGASPRPLARLDIDIPSLADASYRVEQTLGDATTTATFEKDGITLEMRSWVAATEPLLLIEISAKGGTVPVKSSLHVGGLCEDPIGTLRNSGSRINLGREQYGNGRWYLNGLLDEVQIYKEGLSSEEIKKLKNGNRISATPLCYWSFDEKEGDITRDEGVEKKDGKLVNIKRVNGVKGMAIDLDGHTSYVDCPPLNTENAVTVSAFVYLRRKNATQYILTQGEWKNSWSLGISSGKLRMAVGEAFAQSPQDVPLNRWVHVTGVFNGSQIYVYVDGCKKVNNTATAAMIEPNGTAWVERRIDNGVRGIVIPAAAACAYRVPGNKARSFVVEPGKPVTLIAAVDSIFDNANFATDVVKVVSEISETSDLSGIRQEHEAWWKEYWNRSFVEISDKFIEQRYYLSLYGIGSASRNLSFPPGIFGWVTTDTPAWNGDYHMNYNFVAAFYGLGVANRIEQLDPAIQPILDSRKECLAWGKSELGIDGVYMPVGIGPLGSFGGTSLGQKSNGSYSCIPIAERWYTTYDIDFARKAYPYVRDTALFWENWLKWEPFDKPRNEKLGRYVIYKDSAHESSGDNMNSMVSLALVSMVTQLAIDLSTALGVDKNRQTKWRHIHDNISEYPVCRMGDMKRWWFSHIPRTEESEKTPIFRYTEDGIEWWQSNTVGIQHIFPVGAIGLDSDSDLT